jgi:hypothetical protein
MLKGRTYRLELFLDGRFASYLLNELELLKAAAEQAHITDLVFLFLLL